MKLFPILGEEALQSLLSRCPSPKKPPHAPSAPKPPRRYALASAPPLQGWLMRRTLPQLTPPQEAQGASPGTPEASPPLHAPEALQTPDSEKEERRLLEALNSYGILASIAHRLRGPWVTRYSLTLALGVRASKVSSLAQDLSRLLEVPSVQVIEHIPGSPYVGIEVAHPHRKPIPLQDFLGVPADQGADPLRFFVGCDAQGRPCWLRLPELPHLLIAGATGSGKSTLLHSLLASWLSHADPAELQWILMDFKGVEFSPYHQLPQLLGPIITDPEEALKALRWCTQEMTRRFLLFAKVGVRDFESYRSKLEATKGGKFFTSTPSFSGSFQFKLNPTESKEEALPLSRLVLLIDEFSELINYERKSVESMVSTLAQKARAAGIHLIVATQRPSVDVLTGKIKANFIARIAMKVASKADSKVILDRVGAENLFGSGDMLLRTAKQPLQRIHGAWISEEAIKQLTARCREAGRELQLPAPWEAPPCGIPERPLHSSAALKEDPLMEEALAFVSKRKRASISALQRHFRIGYNRAARLIEAMESRNWVSAPDRMGIRTLLIGDPRGRSL